MPKKSNPCQVHEAYKAEDYCFKCCASAECPWQQKPAEGCKKGDCNPTWHWRSLGCEGKGSSWWCPYHTKGRAFNFTHVLYDVIVKGACEECAYWATTRWSPKCVKEVEELMKEKGYTMPRKPIQLAAKVVEPTMSAAIAGAWDWAWDCRVKVRDGAAKSG